MDLCELMKDLRKTNFYNIYDEEKKPIRILGLQYYRGNLFLAKCKYDNGSDEVKRNEKTFHIYTRYLRALEGN